nr:NADPH--cytochrome P450 reductase-like [Ipomoea trifida]
MLMDNNKELMAMVAVLIGCGVFVLVWQRVSSSAKKAEQLDLADIGQMVRLGNLGRLGRKCKVQMVVEEERRRRKWSRERGQSLSLMSSLNFWPQNSLHDYAEKMELHPSQADSFLVYHMWSLPPEFMAQKTTRPLPMRFLSSLGSKNLMPIRGTP